MPYFKTHPLISRLTPWLMWGLAVSAFFIEYLIRVAPTSMVPQLMESFNGSPLDISAFAAYFLYAYVLMQIPVGILLDRFGPRLCLFLSTALCAMSTFLFCYTSELCLAKLARLFFGFGAAFAWVGTLKIALAWFKPHLFSILVGATQTLGMMGGALGTSLMGRLTEQQGWQVSIEFFGILLTIITIFIGLIVRNRPTFAPKNLQTFPLKKGLLIVFQCKQTWLISLFAGLLYMPTAVFAELWGSFYLTTTQSIPLTVANDGIATIFLGYSIGAPTFGFLANRLGRRRIMIFSSFLSLLFITTILYLPSIPCAFLYLLLFIYGFSNSGMVAAYTAIAELHTPMVAGIALGFVNGMSVIVGAFCQQGIGGLMDWLHVKLGTNTLEYTNYELKMVMGIVVIGISIAFIMSFFTKETLKKY